MRMERVSNNQIKCYLNKTDLSSRELNFSEIAYGNPKTQRLFQDMMEKASDELGFDMHNVPIMIEIVPVSYDSIMLIITKVEDPSDIDDQFMEFQQQSGHKEIGKEIHSNIRKAESNPQVSKPVFEDLQSLKHSELSDVSYAYAFDSLEAVISVCRELVKYRISESTLYKDNEKYILLIKNYSTDKEMRIMIAGLMAEYGSVYKNNSVSFDYFTEHCEQIIPDNAISQLARL